MDGEVKTQATGAKPGRSLLAWCAARRTAPTSRRAARARQTDAVGLAADRRARGPRHGRDLARRRHRLRAGAAERRAAVGRAARLAAQRHRRIPHPVRQIRRDRSALRAHGRAERRSEGSQIRNRSGRKRARDAAGDGRARAHRRLPDLAESPSDDAGDAAAAAAHRRDRPRAGRLRRIFALAARPRAARTGGERGAGARAPPTRTSSPACRTTPRCSNCSTSRWPNAPATR